MDRYAIDYSGFFYVIAENLEDAMNVGSEELSKRLPYNWAGGDWEIQNVEVSND